MHKRPGQLNEPLEKIAVRPLPIRQPEFFEHIMGFVKKLVIEAVKETQIVRVQSLPLKRRNALGDLSALLAHALRLAGGPPQRKLRTNTLDASHQPCVLFSRCAGPGEPTSRMNLKQRILTGLIFVQLWGCLCFAGKEIVAQTNTNGDYVVLMHGLIRSANAMKRLEWAFERDGYRVINVTYPYTKHTIEEIASRSLAGVLQERIQDPNARIHFVTHSLGGIVLREYLANNQLTNLGRVVMIAPPNHGSELVDKFKHWPFFKFFTGPAGQQLGTTPDSIPQQLGPATFELGVIAGDSTLNPFYSWFIPGPDDGKVSVASTRLAGMEDFLVVHSSHTYLPWRKQVVDASLQFVAAGKFPVKTRRNSNPAPTETNQPPKIYASPKMQAMR